MAVSFYRSSSAKAALGLAENDVPVPNGAIIFSKDTGSLTGKIYVQTGDAGDTNTLYCYGDFDASNLEQAINDLQDALGNTIDITGIGDDKKTITQIIQEIQAVLGSKAGVEDIEGMLRIDKAWEVGGYDDLPVARSGIRVGDVWKLRETEETYYVKELTVNTNIYVNLLTSGYEAKFTLDCGESLGKAVSEAQFLAEIKDSYKSQRFISWPLLTGSYINPDLRKTLGIGDSGLRVVPINTSSYGLIVMLVIANSSLANIKGTVPCFALSTSGRVTMNSWSHPLQNTGEIIKCLNGVIPANAAINSFFTFGGGIVWERLGGGKSDDELDDYSNNTPKTKVVKQYVDTAIAAIKQQLAGIGSCFDVKGSVANMDLLEAKTDVENGDVWYVESEKAAYFAFVDKDGNVTWNPFATLNLEWR